MFFKKSYITRDFYFGDADIKTSDPTKKIEIVLKKRPPGSEPPPVERYDGLIVAACERVLSKRLQDEAESSGILSIKKEAVQQVSDEMYDCITRTLRLLRWRTGAEGGPNPIRMGTGFSWSVDGTDWKVVEGSGATTIRFQTRLVRGSSPKEDIEFIQKGIIEELNEPLGHELLREANMNHESNPRSSLILAVAAAEVGSKHFASRRLPDTSWLLELPSPPLVDMLSNFPWSQLKLQIDGKALAVPKILIEEFKKAVTLRNRLVHSGVANLSYESLGSVLSSVREFLYFLDSLQGEGQAWAQRFIRPEVLNQFNRSETE